MNLTDRINELLPQTQCGQCGFKGCKPYAEALASGKADINQCPPGGIEGIQALSQLLGISPKPLNPHFGIHKPPQKAFINETDCIGCVKCIAACPVDAIVGAAKLMHTVITDECTGCELCLPPCPVNCIELRPVEGQTTPGQKNQAKLNAKRRYEARLSRLARIAQEKADKALQQKQALLKFNLDSLNNHPTS